MKIGEIAAPTARDQNFLSETVRAFQYGDAASAFSGFDGAHQPGSACSQNQGVIFVGGHRMAATFR